MTARSGITGWRALGPALAVSAAFLAGVAVSWRAWGNLVIDCGRELQVPQRIVDGALLYRDVRYWYGPLGPYLNAALYGLFGVRVEVAAGAGMATAALMCWGLYRLVRHFATPWGAAVVPVAFIGLCAFGHHLGTNLFSWPIPYAYPSIYGITAATWSLAFLLTHLRDGAPRAFLASAALLALVALTKLELLAAIAAIHLLVAGALAVEGRLRWRLHALGWGLALATPTLVYAGFAAAMGPALWSDNLGASFNPGLASFSAHAFGLAEPGETLEAMLRSSLLFGAVLALAAWAARPAARAPGAALPAALAILAAATSATLAFVVDEPLRALPVALLGGLGVSAVKAWREPSRRREWTAAVALFGFALACLARIALRVSPARYGFFLLPPALAALGVLSFDLLPRGLAPPGRGRWPVKAAGAGLLLGAAAAGFLVSARSYARYTEDVSTPRGQIRLASGGVEAAILRRLGELPPETRVLAVAEGAGLVFMSGLLPSRDGMSSYLPVDLVGSYDDDALLARWKADPADLLLLLRRPIPEYGSRGFGVDYGMKCFQWLQENYRPWGEPVGPVVLARRRSTVPGQVVPVAPPRDARRP